ncbi:cobalt import ATP-binding protein [Staphylococcus aureus]|uniref:Cobalt import ATP-binding protein n=1 Tax=Staphylococcus aureus TaxID=1280 RepID=A0A380EML9_STAAU|nr:cobalt import ATP-binding protein [Staphylococcus aureus]
MIGIEKVKSGEIFYNNQAITDDNFEKLRKDIELYFRIRIINLLVQL